MKKYKKQIILWVGVFASLATIYEVFFSDSEPRLSMEATTSAPNSPAINQGKGNVQLQYSPVSEK